MVNVGSYVPSLSADPATAGLVFILVVLGGVLAIAIAFFIWYVAKFNIRVDVEERRGNNVVEYTTRGGIVQNRKTDVKEFRMWRSKWNPFNAITTSPPPNDVYRIDEGGDPVLRVFKDSVDTFKVQKPVPPSGLMDKLLKPVSAGEGEVTYLEPANTAELPEPDDVEWFSWASQTLKSLAPRYRNDEGFWKENKDLVSFIAVIFVFLAGSVFMWNFWTDMSGNLASTSANVKDAMESQERTAKALSGLEEVPASVGNVDGNESSSDGASRRGGSGNFVESIASSQSDSGGG